MTEWVRVACCVMHRSFGKRHRTFRNSHELLFVSLSLGNCSHSSLNLMNFTGLPHSSSSKTPHRRKSVHLRMALYSLRRKYVPPQTPRSQWKFFDDCKQLAYVSSGEGHFRRSRVEVTARKLSAGLWKLWFAEVSSGSGGGIGGLVCGPCDMVGSQVMP